jgi:hypothetical protein
LRGEKEGGLDDGPTLGRALAEELLQRGGDKLLSAHAAR